MEQLPFVSVIILNYNGAQYLPACLDAIKAQTYPPDRFEAIVADNASQDNSLALTRATYPQIKVHEIGRNLGFAGGNNAAMRIARGDYMVLLNNDTAPIPTWLEQLVSVAEQHPRAGIVTGRMQLFYDQLEVSLCCNQDIRVFEVDSGLPMGVAQYLDGFSNWERDAPGSRFRRSKGHGIIGVPVPPAAHAGGFTLRLQLASSHSAATITICAGETALAQLLVTGEARTYAIDVPSHIAAAAMPVVQNAGSIIFANGGSRDRGTVVKNNEALYETDRNQYDTVEEVFAGCGGNMLMRRDMLDDIGSLDDDFFMYYEDTDLSWRARLRGWKVLYAPRAIVRHVHCGSSKEWSPLFLFNVERNRLAMLIKNGSPWQALGENGRYGASVAKAFTGSTVAVALGKPGARAQWGRTLISLRALASLATSLPSLLRKRARIQHTRVASQAEIERWFHLP